LSRWQRVQSKPQRWIPGERIPLGKKVFMKVGVIHELPLVSHPDCREKALPFPLWEGHPCPDGRGCRASPKGG